MVILTAMEEQSKNNTSEGNCFINTKSTNNGKQGLCSNKAPTNYD